MGAGIRWEYCVKMSTCVPLVEGCDLDALRATRAKALGTSEMRASTVLGVRTLVSPELSVEIDLLAAKMPDKSSL